MQLVNLLGTWATGTGPLYRQLADAITRLVRSQQLQPGTVLPTERELAVSLAVSRSTVITAWQLLKQQGTLDSKQGSGTWVAHGSRSLDERVPESDPVASFSIQRIIRATNDPVPAMIDMSMAAFAEPIFLREAMAEVVTNNVQTLSPTAGYLPFGHPVLRETIAAHLTSLGTPTSSEQILVTTGAQQAFHLIASAYLPDCNPVVVETPTWSGSLDVLRAAGARLITTPVDTAGVVVDSVGMSLRRIVPSLIIVTPDYHNPTGARLSLSRREQLIKLGNDFGVPLVEDLSLRGLDLAGQDSLPTLAQLSPHSGVLSIGSLSKICWPGLRIGWIRASPNVIGRLARTRAVSDNGSPVISQLIAASLLPRWHEMAQLRCEQLILGLDALTSALAKQLPSWRWRTPAGGMSLWVELPGGSAYAFAQMANRQFVEFVPGEVFSAARDHREWLRLPLTLPPSLMSAGVSRLESAWGHYLAIQATNFDQRPWPAALG